MVFTDDRYLESMNDHSRMSAHQGLPDVMDWGEVVASDKIGLILIKIRETGGNAK